MQREDQQIAEHEAGAQPPAKRPRRADGKWQEFGELSIVRGISSTHSKRFKPGSRGQQASAACCVAIAIAHLVESPDWRPELIELALDGGDRLYRASRANQPRSQRALAEAQPLTCCQLEPEFYVADYKCRVCVEPALLRGRLPDLEQALRELLLQRRPKEPSYGVLASRARFVALWSRPEDGLLFCFEPGPGDEGSGPAACLLRCAEPCWLAERLASRLGCRPDAEFCIDRLSLVRVERVGRGACGREEGVLQVEPRLLRAFAPAPAGGSGRAGGVEDPVRKLPLELRADNDAPALPSVCCPPLPERQLERLLGVACRELWSNVPASLEATPRDGSVAILHGWTHENSELYKAKGAQTVANCAVAFGVKRVYPVRTWVRAILDRVLALGDELYARIKADNPSVQSVTGADLNDAKFQVDARKMTIDLELLSVVGTLVSKTATVVDVRQGLQEFFVNNSDGILECSSMALAVWKEDDYYYLFDPRSCDINGLHVHQQEQTNGKGKADESPAKRKVIGKCCVMRFSDLGAMDTHILKNIDPSESHDRFTIRHISVVDDIPGTRDWNSFQPAIPGKGWILKGTITSDNEIFDDHGRGLQGLAISVVALVSAKTIPPSRWYKDDVDDVIRQGDSYYNWCVPSGGGGENDGDEDKTLDIKSLKRHLYYKKRKVFIEARESYIMGDLRADNDSDVKNLEKGICSFFEEQQFGIVEANKKFFAVWKIEEELKDKSKDAAFYLMHDNPPKAFIDKFIPAGEYDKHASSACVFRLIDVTEVAVLLNELLQVQSEEAKSDYFIHEMKVASIGEPMTDEEIQKDKATPVKPDLRNYVAFGENGAVLAGSFNQSNEVVFKRETRNRQQAANALVTLAMTKIFDPHLWYREVVDDILKMGDKLTHENLRNLPEGDDEENESSREHLLPTEIDGDFPLGVNQITITIEEDGFSGKLFELQQYLQDFFGMHRMGVFRVDEVMLPIWREERVFFTMDPIGKQSGTACIYWFINLQSFADMLLECTGPSDSEFSIDSLTIENRFTESEPPEEELITEERWFNFSKQSEGIWEISCKKNDDETEQEDENLEPFDTAISIMGIIFSKAYEPRFWSTELLDQIIAAGKTLHAQSVARLGEDKLLRPNEMIHEFFIGDRRIDLKVQDCVQAGRIKSKSSKIQSLRKACVKFFEKFSAGCLTLLNSKRTLAIWTIEDFFYSLKPGNSLMRFEKPESLTEQLATNGLEDDDFEITSVEVLDWNKFPPWKMDPSPAVRPSDLPPLNAYCRLQGKARAILRGFSHQESVIFPEEARGRQTAANCVTSLAMSVIKNPITWTRKTLDGILALGLNLHLESLKDSRSNTSTLKPTDMLRIFQIGPNVLAVDVEAATVTGIVQEAPPEQDEGGKGKKQKADKAKKEPKKKGGATKRVRPQPGRPMLLAEGLDEFFKNNNAGILVTGRFMVAVWRASGVYFMYDPRPRTSQGLREQANDEDCNKERKPRACCVCWFACKQPLYQLIAANVNEDESYASFQICRVLVRRVSVEPLPDPLTRKPSPDGRALAAAGSFERVDQQLSVLPAGSHMAAVAFPPENRGLQSSAVAFVALVLAALHAPSSWTGDLLDAALRHGDALHTECTRLRRQGARNLSPGELPSVFVVGELRARLHLDESFAAGLLIERDLLQALRLFFDGSATAGVLHTSGLALAVVRHWDKYYLLDPTDRSPFREASLSEGAACMLRCDSLSALARAVVAVCALAKPTVYTLNAVQVEEMHFFSR